MKDLYKRIGLSLPTDNLNLIKKALENSDIPHAIRESAYFILLDPKRKKVYDRNHKLLKIIGQLRANKGLNRTRYWLSSDCQDFDCESQQTQKIKNPKVSSSNSFLGKIKNLIIELFTRIIYFAFVIGIVFGPFILIGLFVDSCNDNSSPRTSSNYSSPSDNYRIPDTPEINRTAPVYFNEPALSLPVNGSVVKYHSLEAIAPLEIKTRSGSGNYYVKLVTAYTNKMVLTVFVREGCSVEIDVPLGSYQLKYAVGKTWYGTEHLFGPNTACSIADDIFYFRTEGLHVTGYSVELYLQVNGNLETERIPVSEF